MQSFESAINVRIEKDATILFLTLLQHLYLEQKPGIYPASFGQRPHCIAKWEKITQEASQS
jgi:hypothetical protein